VMTIPGIDGEKMSKSYGNTIDIFVPEKELLKRIKSIVTDSKALEEPKNPDDDTVFKLYSLLATPEQTEAMRLNYITGGYGYGHAKQALYELIIKKYAREREIFQHYMRNLPELDEKLRQGAEKATQIGSEVLARVRQKIGYVPRPRI
jgi:tryptophanyl-tRNA synthetase